MPLYLLYHSSKDHRILEYVLKADSSLAMHTENTFSAQTLVNRLCTPWTSKQFSFCPESLESNVILQDRWTKMVLTVQAAYAHTMGKNLGSHSKPELHVALELECPPMIICHFVRVYPQQASILMEGKDCYPLHYILSEYDLKEIPEVLIETLVDIFPQAVSHTYQQELPIHIGVSNGLNWKAGLWRIAFAGHDGLDQPHPQSGLIPLLHSATMDDIDLSTVYCLLQEHPLAIRNLRVQKKTITQ